MWDTHSRVRRRRLWIVMMMIRLVVDVVFPFHIFYWRMCKIIIMWRLSSNMTIYDGSAAWQNVLTMTLKCILSDWFTREWEFREEDI